MTVIAYRDGIMAADTLETWGSTKMPCGDKIRVVAGHLVGLSGDGGAAHKFVSWFASDRTKDPDFKTEEFHALVVDGAGRLQWWDKNLSPGDVALPFFAIGAGQDLALGAMERGATAIEAAAVACKWNTACGGEVQHKRVSDLKPKRKR